MDPSAVALRQAAIAKVMAQVERRRLLLAQHLREGAIDLEDARMRNAGMPGILGQRWAEFIELPLVAQTQALETLSESRFHGMAWQSLLQCSPLMLKQAAP
ncbi:MAG: hypothetical protein LBQ32_13320 [Burkholderiaceae bacterium]|jgi:hypothetical protein|nr:hypothetical protein [Burkholderiaceae bacterium]